MKKLFKAIRDNDLDIVKKLLENKPELVNCIAKQPPKKDDGQSPLQVAFKTGKFDIADYLVQKGANVNFIEQSEVNEWHAPVLHDCIRSALHPPRIIKDNSDYEQAVSLLQLLLEKGANPNARDSYGNSCLNIALLDAHQVVTSPAFDMNNPKIINRVKSIFESLITAGADIYATVEGKKSAIEDVQKFRLETYDLLN